jgi:hypothetical protein
MNKIIDSDKYYIVENPNLIDDCEYKHDIFNKFKNNEFSFKEIHNLKDDVIYDFNKIFINHNSFHAVAPCIKRFTGYTEHIKETYKNRYIDKENEVLLLIS